MGVMDNPRIQNLLQQYEQLETGDRLALNGLFVFITLLLVYMLVWSPVNDYYDESLENQVYQLSVLQHLRATQARARSSARGALKPGVSGQDLLSTVSSSAQRSGIKTERIQPESSGGVSVWFNNVIFNDLIGWLEDLRQQGFSVKQISIEKQEESGKVNARIVLRS